jgi:hypothetical protein
MASESNNGSTFIPGRRLCPDGSCIGIIGGDGRCTVCGSSDAGGAGSPAPVPSNGDAQNDMDDMDGMDDWDDRDVERSEPGPGEPTSGFDPNRRLCGDDDCIGVIGEDNRCRLCGKPAAG